LNILETKCKQATRAFHKGLYIQRIISTFNDDFGVIYPKKGERESRNTNNIYTLIINESPKWKMYPKREVICSSEKYNSVYSVFPFNGAKIGVCKDYDMWGSFSKLGFSAPIFNEALENVLKLFNKKMPMSYAELENTTSDISIDDIDWYRITKAYYDDIERLIEPSHETLFDLIMYAYGDPKTNGFKLKKIGDMLPEGKEVWTDSPCLFIDKYYIDEMVLSNDNTL
jgi:hypothetical protein